MFKRTKIKTSNYLKLFLNINKEEYSEKEKERLVNTFISTLEKIFINVKLKYDIGGHGYGISKGQAYFGIRALRNKFNKKGYGNMYSVSCSALEHSVQAAISFIPVRETKFCSLYFVVPFDQCQVNDLIQILIQKFEQIASIDYGYGYPVGKGFFALNEGYEKKGLFSYTFKGSPDRFEFEDKSSLCLEGKIKQLSELNIFNKKQSDFLKSSGIKGIKSVEGINYLILNAQELSELEHMTQAYYI